MKVSFGRVIRPKSQVAYDGLPIFFWNVVRYKDCLAVHAVESVSGIANVVQTSPRSLS
jgi:hypothetical protein